MTFHFKITKRLRDSVLRDLGRPHAFAAERVGFLSCKPAGAPLGLIIAASEYHVVADQDYLRDRLVGAMMGPDAIRKALQIAYNNPASMFHVHVHHHKSVPSFSYTDLRETEKFVLDFFNVQPNVPHGAIILSEDSGVGRCWYRRGELPIWIPKITLVGAPMAFIQNLRPQVDSKDKAF